MDYTPHFTVGNMKRTLDVFAGTGEKIVGLWADPYVLLLSQERDGLTRVGSRLFLLLLLPILDGSIMCLGEIRRAEYNIGLLATQSELGRFLAIWNFLHNPTCTVSNIP